jgi:hypothetical protein
MLSHTPRTVCYDGIPGVVLTLSNFLMYGAQDILPTLRRKGLYHDTYYFLLRTFTVTRLTYLHVTFPV